MAACSECGKRCSQYQGCPFCGKRPLCFRHKCACRRLKPIEPSTKEPKREAPDA